MSEKILRSVCIECKGDRNHRVLAREQVSYDQDYHASSIYMILRCLGCDNLSFRQDYEDYEQGNANSDADGGWEYPVEIKIFPKYIAGHVGLDRPYAIPGLVRKIYLQTLSAIKEDATILVGLGLRAIIEAVCNDLTVTGSNLEKRINSLSSRGHISKKDAERLHAIRFLGNDAAHDIKEAVRSQVDVALRIVEHLLTSVYILDSEIDGMLDTLISEMKDFRPLLEEKVRELAVGEVLSLVKIIGKSLRRVQECLPALEAELISLIVSGEFKKLALDAVQSVGAPPKTIQTYKVL